MKHKFVMLVVSLFIFSTQGAHTASAVQDRWKFLKNQDEIEIYQRNFPGSNLKEFKGIMYVKGVRLSSMVATFDDTRSYTRWMHNCTETKLLKYLNVHERLTYTVTHVPWPASDRDTVVYSLMSQKPDDLTVTIDITGRPDYIPRMPDRVRIPMMKATWSFRPLKSGVVMVVYQTVTDPGGPLPLLLLNLSVIDLPFYTMYKFRKVIRERRYASSVYRVIEEPVVN
ncbi:MAG: hypothetical protein A2176_07490 [Spirochaetes bacterium RBG_13_51_14]|nr:MAG: hypothetical protein A2176_07490 [Spirochaetes bacterium RBG_13_51_14]